MKPLKQLCVPRDSVFDISKRDTVLNLSHLTDGKIEAKAFFEENYVTEGMKTLLTEAFRRLEGKSEQAVFKLTQAKNGLATMVMEGGSFRSCGRGAHAGHAAKSKVIRHLWGAGAGKFRTKGRFAAASIRGTTWDSIDRCDGTLVKVTQGRVTVTDLKRHKNVVVKKGKSYLAKA